MREPTWLSLPIIEALHSAQIQEHGGSMGTRDEGLIRSALSRPLNRWNYEADADIADLAAAYTYGLSSNHGFIDGNKRVAFMAAYTFLGVNGYDLEASEPEVVLVMRDLAASRLEEGELAEWFRGHLRETG